MDFQFKIIGYTNSRDYQCKKNGIEITDIITLLNYVNKSHYWDLYNCKEVEPNEDWDICYNELIEYHDSPLSYIDIIEKPTDINLRIIGVSIFYALPQRTNNVIYDSIEDVRLAEINKEECNFYPYTMDEFIYLLTNNVGELSLKTYNYIAILNH